MHHSRGEKGSGQLDLNGHVSFSRAAAIGLAKDRGPIRKALRLQLCS